MFACLRSSLDSHICDLPRTTRSELQRCVSARYTAFADPFMALALYLDGLWGPARGRVAGLVWAVRESVGGRTLPELRDVVIAFLADGGAALAARLQAEISDLMAFDNEPARPDSWRRLYRGSWWRPRQPSTPSIQILGKSLKPLQVIQYKSDRIPRDPSRNEELGTQPIPNLWQY